jgi:arginine N-succinyltransferase
MLLIAGPDVIRLAPALIVSDAQIAEADRIMRAPPTRSSPAKRSRLHRPGPQPGRFALTPQIREFHVCCPSGRTSGYRRPRDAWPPSTPGVHTLPRTREKIAAFVERSIASFAAHVDIPSEESYLFVLEDLARELVGTAAIHASAGSNGTYFAFRNDVIQQVSRDLNISHSVHALTLCSELTAYSQLSGFTMRDRDTPALKRRCCRVRACCTRCWRRTASATASSCRWPASPTSDGQSPFWNALGRKFFKMDFLDAERVIGGARNRTLIVELMPHYPVYVPLLPGDAQAAMGQIHPSGQLAFDLLTEEGFEADEYIDIFDGGPILQAHKNALRSFRGSMRRVDTRSADAAPDAMVDLRGRQQRAQFPRHPWPARRPTPPRPCACPLAAAGAGRRAGRQRHLRRI